MKRSSHWLRLGSFAIALALLGCGDNNANQSLTCETPATPPAGAPKLLLSDCDSLVPTQCGYPFPSNVYLEDDATTITGKRVAFGKTTLPMASGVGHLDPSWWAGQDGFSAGEPALTHLPGATTEGLPTEDTIELSLSDDSPTILLDAETGERIPHFSEIDQSIPNEDDAERAFLVRPVVRLKDATRYIVAIRNVVDADGKKIPASPAFTSLRDNTPSCDPSVEARRALYADIFTKLEAAKVPKENLQIAWDFTTSSRENNTSKLIAMRDDALAQVGELGPEYKISKFEEFTEAENATTWRRLLLTMNVPLYLDKKEPGGKLILGPNGLPKQNGFAEYDVIVHIPHIAKTQKVGLVQNGHGLLGDKEEGQNGYLTHFGNLKGYITFSVDFIGMASDDVASISDALVTDAGQFRNVVDRQHQGILNSLLAMRMMAGRFVNDPNTQWNGAPIINPELKFYRGDSQGGIFGTTYMAVSTDVKRGLVSVPGMPYTMLLDRSKDFGPFFLFLKGAYETGRNIQLIEGLMQMLWDRTEPNGYAPYIRENTLPNTPPHDLLIHVAIGDHQVTPLGAHIIARTIKAKNLSPTNRPIYGLEEAPAPLTGAAIVEYDYGVPEAPKTNTPMTLGEDPHGDVRKEESAMSRSDTFFRTGTIEHLCEGPCNPK